ncbi:MAG TPA: PEP-utilizing enzyme [Candidatus Paceibacterota bacterium]|nr:PEP-utilizing enzyme [Candidatus Pacearchaeota archaeon]HRZ50381.1 PEP-utilizing enzyme [Candidatus Paceibacterota bacterium]HSA36102.1 PEP-utilizing enzyme [Candidatus Paceibacterota bacterium]
MADKCNFEIGQERAQVNFLTAYAIAKGYERFSEILGCEHPEVVLVLAGGQYASYFSVSGLKKLSNCIERGTLAVPEAYRKRLKKQFTKDFAKAKKSSASGKSAAKRAEGAVSALSLVLPYIAALRYYEAAAVPNLERSLIGRGEPISKKELASVVSADSYISLLYRERIGLLGIALKYYGKTVSAAFVESMERHAKKYSAYIMHGTTDGRQPYDHFKKRLDEVSSKPKCEIKKELQTLINAPIKTKTEKKKIRGKHRFSNQERELIKTLELASKIKARITDSVFIVAAIADAIEILSKKWGIDKNYLYRLRPEEIISYSRLKAIPDNLSESLKKREKAAIWVKNSRVKIFFGAAAESFEQKKVKINNEAGNIISGTPIFQGRVCGRVKVVRSPRDFFKVESGDIVVCGDFSPDFAVLADKISAIVANEGGVMSHAAIVAREMKIPCVAGTKIATKMLKDGDMVEIDSFTGIVKIINRVIK